jgi:hypothetical protein
MLGFGKTQASGLAELLAKKKYAKAIEVIRAELQARGHDKHLRMQLADVLQRAGRGGEAVPLLLELADDFALSGAAAKAIAALKRAQAIAPGQPQVEGHLAYLIAQQKAPTPDPWHRAKAALETGATGPDPGRAPEAAFLGDMEEIGSEAPGLPAAAPAAAAPPPAAASGAARLVLDTPAASAPSAEDLAEEEFVDEVIALFDDVLAGRLQPAQADLTAVPAVDSPLFREFSCEELTEVIRGLRLRAFAPGEIIVSEGESGDRLFVLTSGEVRTYVRGAQGHHTQVRMLQEGDFFGEVSLLEFEGRTATITAAGHCELLEFDRATLDRISRTHPRIWDVIRRFYQARSGSPAELAARAQGPSS